MSKITQFEQKVLDGVPAADKRGMTADRIAYDIGFNSSLEHVEKTLKSLKSKGFVKETGNTWKKIEKIPA